MNPSALRWTTVITLLATVTLAPATSTAAQESDHRGGKSPGLALALSLVLPGAGQVYNGHHLKGAAMFGGVALTAGSILLSASDVLDLDDDTSGTRTHVLGAAGVGLLLWSWIDAPLSARAINRRLETGGLAVEVGAGLYVAPTDNRVLLSVLRVAF